MTVPTRKEVQSALRKNQTREKAISKEQRRKYAYIKEKAMALERNNNSECIVFPAVDEPWYRAGDFSALVYALELGPRMNRTSKVLIDTDKGSAQFKWTISIHDFESLKAAMAKIKMTEITDYGEGIYGFKLGRRYTEKEVKQLYKQVDDMIDELRNLVGVDKLYPKFYGQMIKVLPVIFQKVKRLEATAREMIGQRMWTHAMQINATYLAIARKQCDGKSGLKKIMALSDVIMDETLLLSNLGLWDPMTAVKVAKMMLELKELAEKAIGGEGVERAA